MTRHPSHRVGRVLLVGAALPLTVTISGLAASAASATDHSSTPTAKSLVAASEKAITAKQSVHFEVASVASGTDEKITADAGKTVGQQVITSGAKTARVELTKTDAYFSGNSSGLSTFFGMPSSDVKLVGTKWVDIKAGTSQYTSFKNGMVIPALDSSFFPTTAEEKTAKVKDGTASGKATYLIEWTITSNGSKVDETLAIDATGSDLPLTEKGVSGKNHTLATFSKWGEQISLSKPKATIAFTKLTG